MGPLAICAAFLPESSVRQARFEELEQVTQGRGFALAAPSEQQPVGVGQRLARTEHLSLGQHHRVLEMNGLGAGSFGAGVPAASEPGDSAAASVPVGAGVTEAGGVDVVIVIAAFLFVVLVARSFWWLGRSGG
jgi:hypothetical protein